MTAPLLPPADSLESGLEFEAVLSEASASLHTVPPEELPRAAARALDRVRELFRADRCALLSVSADEKMVTVRLASYAEGVAEVPAGLDLGDAFPWSYQRLLVERAPVRLSSPTDLPPEADVERRSWDGMSIRSALTLPIETRGGALYLILLNAVHQEREWPEAVVTRLRVFGEMLACGLERQTMFAGLREAEARVSLAADAAEAGLWALDPVTRSYWATERAREIFGYSKDEVISTERFEASVHPDDRDRVRAAIERSLHGSDALSVEYRILQEDGRERWIASRGRPRFGPTGELDRLTGLSVDVTEQRLAEEATRRSEARLAAGAKLAGLGYYEVDYGTGWVTGDAGFREVCGLPPELEEGLQFVEFWLDHLSPDDRERVKDVRQRMHDGRDEQVSMEYRYLHPTRGEMWIHHLGVVATRDASGRAVLTYGVLRDITLRKRNENELRDLSRRLIQTQEAERALIARELHDDLTQRLAVLAIDVGRVEGLAQDSEHVQGLHQIREGLVRLSEDVHALAYRLHPAVLEELGLVEALRAECERCGRLGGPTLSVELAEATATVDRETALCLFRVAQEALHNALRHAAARSLSVVLQPMEGGLVLAVRDDGVGFDVQADREVPSLGLASMRERVSLVHGTLDVESAPGQGTAVVAWVPVGEAVP